MCNFEIRKFKDINIPRRFLAYVVSTILLLTLDLMIVQVLHVCYICYIDLLYLLAIIGTNVKHKHIE